VMDRLGHAGGREQSLRRRAARMKSASEAASPSMPSMKLKALIQATPKSQRPSPSRSAASIG
jgi:hypothetical protein